MLTTYLGVYFPSWPKLDFLTAILPLLPNFWLVAWIIFSSVFVFKSLSPPIWWLLRRFFDLFLFASIVHTFMTEHSKMKRKNGCFLNMLINRNASRMMGSYLVFLVVFPFWHIYQQRLLLSFYLYFFAITFLNGSILTRHVQQSTLIKT